jgi:hypothetical protein
MNYEAKCHADGLLQDQLKSDINPSALGGLPSPARGKAYKARLVADSMLPELRAVLARIQAAVP